MIIASMSLEDKKFPPSMITTLKVVPSTLVQVKDQTPAMYNVQQYPALKLLNKLCSLSRLCIILLYSYQVLNPKCLNASQVHRRECHGKVLVCICSEFCLKFKHYLSLSGPRFTMLYMYNSTILRRSSTFSQTYHTILNFDGDTVSILKERCSKAKISIQHQFGTSI